MPTLRDRRMLVLGLAILMLGVSGGALAVGEAVRPPEIVPGESRCANYPCQMIIKDVQHSAGLVTSAGEFTFCDIGCLLVYMKTKVAENEEILRAFVHDWPSGEWTDARTATYVRTEIRTPMRYGLIAFASADEARSYRAQNGGELLDLQQATHYVMTERAKRMGSATEHGK
ncbi:nitrous oxide reductase accessory protein NosL [Carboxydochorda subterranea]|uniref:Nitrous oxide reductase accessory protein NosL n=1 Tax=Carboxydichorda subterranea TaxID=3109565 RepID=A0ABZ1BXJ0_9FIRM|nr:nitrous oxide reductase accessory protein NosL [Limnochorda sp. L945t]WRP17529.1 nitrous oxide reductase accessory protein NosL [Limnochorda sp. L945t]